MLYLFGLLDVAHARTCNGQVDLCNKLYNQVTYPTSHNALSYIPTLNLEFNLRFLPQGWATQISNIIPLNVNDQDLDLMEQLKDGIRAMKLRVMLAKGIPYICHGMGPGVKEEIKERSCKKLPFSALEKRCGKQVDRLEPCSIDPAAVPLSEALRTVALFLQENPNEVITVFLEDTLYSFEDLNKVFEESGIAEFAFHQKIDEPWPSLREMIRRNKRLVVFESLDRDKSGREIGNYSTFNYFPHFVWGSRYHFESVEELLVDEPKENDLLEVAFTERNLPPRNKLWLLQHFITPDIAGKSGYAAEVNKAAVLTDRINKYRKVLGTKPNFIWVDFYELPKGELGLFHIVNQLNHE